QARPTFYKPTHTARQQEPAQSRMNKTSLSNPPLSLISHAIYWARPDEGSKVVEISPAERVICNPVATKHDAPAHVITGVKVQSLFLHRMDFDTPPPAQFGIEPHPAIRAMER